MATLENRDFHLGSLIAHFLSMYMGENVTKYLVVLKDAFYLPAIL